MNRIVLLLCMGSALVAAAGAVTGEKTDALTGRPLRKGHADFGRDKRSFAAKPGTDSVRVSLTMGEALRCGLQVGLSDGAGKAPNVGFAPLHQSDEHKYVAYSARGKLTKEGKLPPTDWYADAMLAMETPRGSGWFGCRYYFLPFFSESRGIYGHELVRENLPRWRELYAPIETRTMDFRFEYNPAIGRTEAYLDNQYCGLVPGSGTVERISCAVSPKATVNCAWYKAERRPSGYALPPLRHRASPLLGKDARLSFKGNPPFEPWAIGDSLDSSRHYRTSYTGDFGWNSFYSRTPFEEGTEYMHWSVPPGAWLYAYVLCADIPEEGKVPVLGTRLSILGQVNRDSIAEDYTDLSTAATNGNIRTVGTLDYLKDGRKTSVPLYLVRQRMSVEKMLAVWNDKPIWRWDGEKDALRGRLPRKLEFPHFDFEFVGAGSDSTKMVKWGRPRSSVQIFGARLGLAPFGFDVSESERGNIFENDERPETGWEITAFADDTEGAIEYRIYDDAFRTLRTGVEKFRVAKAGEVKRVSVDLSMPEVGWYGIDFTLRDAKGREVAFHRAAFTLLGKNDREAGFESPYAAWPQGTTYEQGRDGRWGFPQLGRHNSNPNRHEVAKLMHKAGYHSAWSVPVSNEQEHAEWRLTLSAHAKFANPPCWPSRGFGKPFTAAELAKVQPRIDAAVACYREEKSRYPHCHTIQILHEQGGKGLAKELRTRAPAVAEPYRGTNSPGHVYWCTELAKRMRQEFPNDRLCIGNGSSASEMIGSLCRMGFDLSLVDELGIESKGFGSMPEIPDCLESPGMLWALRETGRRFGYTNFTMNACNEYVFRTERTVDETWSRARRMQVTDFTLRDYLLSLAWGCRTISTGHPEDCFTSYYESNWGAGGQCKFYPYSYPKRMFTALANFTKVFDRAQFSRRVPTGEISTYALEFRRDRKVKDFATAFWTPQHGAELKLEFAPGAAYRHIDWQGRERELKIENGEWKTGGGTARLTIGSTPTYVVSDRPIAKVTVVRHFQDDLGTDRMTLLASCGGGHARGAEAQGGPWHITRGDYEGIAAVPGKWAFESVRDAEAGEVIEAKLLPNDDPLFPELGPEYGRIELSGAKEIPAGWEGRIGVTVKGNGSFGRVVLEVRDKNYRKDYFRLGYRGYACFNGWAVMTASTKGSEIDRFPDRSYRPVAIWFSTTANALDPLELKVNPEPLRFKDVVLLPSEDVSKGYELDAARSAEALKFVPEKDL